MRKRLTQAVVVLSIWLACCSFAFALDPALDISQYAHTAWKVRDGFAKGFIYAIAQTPDGYLWLGTEFGLLRFDGVRAVPGCRPMANSPAMTFRRCWSHVTVHFGSAQPRGLPVGKMESSPPTPS